MIAYYFKNRVQVSDPERKRSDFFVVFSMPVDRTLSLYTDASGEDTTDREAPVKSSLRSMMSLYKMSQIWILRKP
jgi:hypothetical protein